MHLKLQEPLPKCCPLMFIFEMIHVSNTKYKKWPIIHVLFIIDRYRMELLCLCAYFGSLMAVRLGYDEIVGPLLRHARYVVQG